MKREWHLIVRYITVSQFSYLSTRHPYLQIQWALCQNGVEFPSAPSLAGKKTLWQLASPCCWNHALRLKCFLSVSAPRKKSCNSAHEQTSLSKDTVDSVLRQREVFGAKDLSAPPRMYAFTGRLCVPKCVQTFIHRNAPLLSVLFLTFWRLMLTIMVVPHR